MNISTAYDFAKLTLAQEDAFGRVLAGATGKGGKTLWKTAKQADGSTISNFIKAASKEVDAFEKTMDLTSSAFDKSTIKAIKKAGKNNKDFYQKMTELFSKGNVDEKAVKSFLEKNGITEVTQKTGFFKKIGNLFKKGGSEAVIKSTDDIAKSAVNGLDDVAKAATKSSKGIFSKLKGKGGTIGIALTAIFELPIIVKAFKNGDGLQQIGRSTLNIGGFAAGAAAGAAIGSIIPGAGTAVGAVIGGIAGFVGGMLGGSIGDKVGEKIFGKSIESQKEEAALAQESGEAIDAGMIANDYIPGSMQVNPFTMAMM